MHKPKPKKDTYLMKIYYPKGSDVPQMTVNYDEALAPIIGELKPRDGRGTEELRDFTVATMTAAFLGALILDATEKFNTPVSLYTDTILENLAATIEGKDPKTASRLLSASLRRKITDRKLAEADRKIKGNTPKC